MLDDQILDILFVDLGFEQVKTAAELVFHSQGIDHGDDTIEPGQAVFHIIHAHSGDRTDGLGDGCRLADAAGLNDDIVEALHTRDVAQLFDEVHLQRAADTSVLQGHKTLVFFAYDATLLYQGGIDVHFADVIDDDGKFDAALVGEYSV